MSTGLGVVEWWLHWMLQMSWQVAVLAVAVWALTRLLRRSSASLRYSLWLLVFIKLLLPPGLSAPWSPATVAANAWPAGVRWTVDMPAVHSTSTAPAQWPALSADTFTESAPVADTPPVTVSPAPKAAVSVPHAIMAIWAVVALGLLLLMTFQWRLHSRRLLRDAVLAPEEILVWGRTQALLLGLRRPVEIYVSPQVLVPCVMGFRKAIVFLPQDLIARLSPAQQADLIAHEMAHIKRGDLWTGWFASTLVCLYWFHPAVWLANFQLRREREMACDDKVLHATRREGTEYASTMVRVAEGFRGGVPAGAGFLGLFELADNLLQRVRAVSDATRTRRAGWRASITVVVVALAVIPMGAWTSVSHAQATPPQPAASAEPQQAPPAAAQPAEKASEAPTDNVQAAEKEIAEHYAAAAPELKEYIKWTARTFGRGGMWLPENAFESLTPEQREEKVKYLVEVLNGEYGRYLCGALAEAGVLKDARLLPGLTKHAGYHREDSDYDCRPKWIAVASLGRHDEPSSAPLLVDLVDHGNQNTKMWAQASMSRLTGQNFGTDKKAWAEWWNANGKKPKIDVAALKAWKPVGESAPAVGAGRMGKVLRFDGVDDYIHIPSTPQLDLTADVTVGAWIKVDPECRGEAAVFFRGDTQIGRDPYGLGVDSGRMRFYVDLLGGQGAETRFAASGDLDGAWHYWVGVRDAAAGRVCLYRDGRLMSEVQAVGKREFDSSGMYNEMGSIDHGKWGPWGFFKGELDQLSVWNVARTPEEIEREFREGLKGNEAGLVALWTFDEDGQTINDKSTSGITGTLGSTPDADANDPARVAAEE